MSFEVEAQDQLSSARAACITTDHGKIRTPIFMPVGTQGTVKAIAQPDLRDDAKAQIILGNTYHLYLRPGTEVLHKAGGLHRFMSWDMPILTDSGGYQVFSLASRRKLKEEGAYFQSHIDGRKIVFTPESVVDIQRVIGSDIMMAFDECPPHDADYRYAKDSLERTIRWMHRGWKHLHSQDRIYEHSQAFFPIVQGTVFKDLREHSAQVVSELGAPGNAIGGLAVGEPAETMYEMIEVVNGILPKDKPRYLMGVGTPTNILEAIALGVDMFDCVMPTRNARNGTIFTWEGTINLRNEKWKDDYSPLDPLGTSYVDKMYSKAYVRHLTIAKEILGAQIASLHNIAFYLDLVGQARAHIMSGDFLQWKERVISKLSQRL